MENLFRKYPVRQALLLCLALARLCPEAKAQQYFQQEVNYSIHVELNDRRHELHASEAVEYINHSPDTLRFLYFHLWPNAYSANSTALAKQLTAFNGKSELFADPELRGYIDSLDFRTGGEQLEWHLLPGQPDICRIMLSHAAAPGDTVVITTPFHVKIPKGVTSRLGHIGESYQVSQWYPKPAVYDRDGWHPMPYLDQGEFYSEFGSFDVSITLPANYIVGATGDMHSGPETEMLAQLAADTAWKTAPGDSAGRFPPSLRQLKTLQFTARQVHDFAWFADKRFHVMQGSVTLPRSGREVITRVMFTGEQAWLWKDALGYVNSAILNYSEWIGDYPYNSFTAVQSALNAGAGMEYPGITVIGLAADAYDLDGVITHEICHSWFYSALATNERRYPFMDEGLSSAYESRLMNEKYPGKKLWEVYVKNRKLARFFHVQDMPVQRMQEFAWLVQARGNQEQPANLPAPDFTYLNYSTMIYGKAATSFNYLRAYLGDSAFDAALQGYYLTWKGRHPGPEDLRNVFGSPGGKNLDWFFSDLVKTTKRLDYKIVSLENQQLLVSNNGELASPLLVAGIKGDSTFFELRTDGFTGRQLIGIPPGGYDEIRIDPGHITPEICRLNNNIRTAGWFRKADPVRAQFYFTLDDPEKRTVMYIPAVNWTGEDGFMIGMAVHNGFLLPKPFEYFVLPFYSFTHHRLAGFGRISCNIAPYSHFIRMSTLSLEGTRFGAPGKQVYSRVKAGADLYFRAAKMTDPLRHKVFGYLVAASDLARIEMQEKAAMIPYLQLGYQLENTGVVNPFSLRAVYECSSSYRKTTAEFNYRYSYYGTKNGLEFRLFAGAVLKNNADVPFYALSASGRSGRELYLYQGVFPDRFSVFPDNFWSRQMDLSEGGLVSPVSSSHGYSRRLVSLSVCSSLPGKAGRVPVKPFVNLLLTGRGTGSVSPLFYEAGLKAGIWKLFEVYVPLLVSGNIAAVSRQVKDRIRIVLDLNSLRRVNLNTKTL